MQVSSRREDSPREGIIEPKIITKIYAHRRVCVRIFRPFNVAQATEQMRWRTSRDGWRLEEARVWVGSATQLWLLRGWEGERRRR